MSDPKNARGRNLVGRFDAISFGAGLVEKVFSNWTALGSYLSGGALMGGLAYLQDVPPIAWGVAALAGIFFVALIRAISSWGRSKDAQARLFAATAVTPGAFNRLQTEFVRQQIRVTDLIHPLGEPLTGKVFIECEFLGPGLLAMSGSHVDGMVGGNVELIKVRAERIRQIPNKAHIHNSHLKSCKFFNVAIALTAQTADELIKITNGTVPVLGE